MFTVDRIHVFPAEPARCRLHGWVSTADSSKLRWSLSLESKCVLTDLIPPEDRGPGWDRVGIRVHCEDIDLVVSEWAPLRIPMQSIAGIGGASGFRLQEWEPLLALRLEASGSREGMLDFVGEGTGAVESVQEWFGGAKVDFRVHTQTAFPGIFVDVPTDHPDPLAYAETIRAALFPGFRCEAGQVQRQTHSGVLASVTVHYAPGAHD